MGMQGAQCFHTLTKDQRFFAKPAWDQERFGMLCTKASNFAALKADLEKLCQGNSDCTYAVGQNFTNIQDQISKLQASIRPGPHYMHRIVK